MKLGFWSVDWELRPDAEGKHHLAVPGGVNFWRTSSPARELSRHGYEVVLSARVAQADDGHIRVQDFHQQWHDDCDIIVFSRWMTEEAVVVVGKAVASGQVVINDVDDDFWAIPTTNRARRTTDPAHNPKANREHYRRVLAASSALICSTQHLATALSRLGPPTFVCRNAIDLRRWPEADPGELIGWVGGTFWRANDLPLLQAGVVPYLREHNRPFYHGGHHPDATSAATLLGYENVVTLPMCPVDMYPRLWGPLETALIPLEDCSFNRAKSWVKGLEACARGIPFIASRLPEYEALGAGRLAKRPWEWRQHLEELEDPALREAEGRQNRSRAEALSIERQWTQWDAVFREMACDSTSAAATTLPPRHG